MERRVVKGVNINSQQNKLPRSVDLEIYWPIPGTDMKDPLSCSHCLRYVDATAQDGTQVWKELGRYRSLSEAQKGADAAVGRSIGASKWVSPGKQ